VDHLVADVPDRQVRPGAAQVRGDPLRVQLQFKLGLDLGAQVSVLQQLAAAGATCLSRARA
jgi:hypothetical protein